MTKDTDEILERLKNLTALETSELVKQIEDTFGVNASANKALNYFELYPVGMPVFIVETEDEFDVILEEVPADKKISVLKVLRSLTALGLKEAKDFVESVPQMIKGALNRPDAEDIKQQLEAVGAKVSIK